MVVVRVRDQHASTSLISIPALSEPCLKSDFRNTRLSTICRLLYCGSNPHFQNVKPAKELTHFS